MNHFLCFALAILPCSQHGLNDEPTLTRLDGTTYTIQRHALSMGDIKTFNTMYPTNYITSVDAACRDQNKIDVLMADGNGAIATAARDSQNGNGNWMGWWGVTNGKTAPGGAVTLLSRLPNGLDAFTVGTDGKVYTAWWNQDIAKAKWQGWWPIGNLVCLQGAKVAAISRQPTLLDLFAVGLDGRIYTAFWNQSESKGQWNGWWPLETGFTVATQVCAASRHANNLETVAISAHGKAVWNSSWDGNQWSKWKKLP